ncbi:MAG TPA: hypothetical protein VEV17_09070 [Bryobacteraceae bacterium]|nr:hypothetical protein [Bryobacteraceae bacterium]
MNRFNKFLAATFLSAAMLFAGAAAQAMPFQQFDHMAAQDRQDYLNFLVGSAQKVLKAQDRDADAAKVHRLFTEIRPGDNLPIGEAEFEMNLDNARVRDAEKAIQNPNAPRVQVESALALTLSKNGIQITPDFVKDFVQLANTFKPQVPATRKKK